MHVRYDLTRLWTEVLTVASDRKFGITARMTAARHEQCCLIYPFSSSPTNNPFPCRSDQNFKGSPHLPPSQVQNLEPNLQLCRHSQIMTRLPGGSQQMECELRVHPAACSFALFPRFFFLGTAVEGLLLMIQILHDLRNQNSMNFGSYNMLQYI